MDNGFILEVGKIRLTKRRGGNYMHTQYKNLLYFSQRKQKMINENNKKKEKEY